MGMEIKDEEAECSFLIYYFIFCLSHITPIIAVCTDKIYRVVISTAYSKCQVKFATSHYVLNSGYPIH